MQGAQGEWYADGLRFECTQCGNCCTGPPGFVRFTDNEAAAIARHLEIPVAQFRNQFTCEVTGCPSLKEQETEHGFDCIFLDRDSVPGKAMCSIYPVRPTQCRTWPFWRENLAHPRDWQRGSRTCPGIGKGPIVPIEAIRIHRDVDSGGP